MNIRVPLCAVLFFVALAFGMVVSFPLLDAKEDDDDDTGRSVQPLATRSSPIAITSDDKFVWSVNPDNDSVSVFRVAEDANTKVAEIPVGKEPWCVAITSGKQQGHDGRKKKHDDDDDERLRAAAVAMLRILLCRFVPDRAKKCWPGRQIRKHRPGRDLAEMIVELAAVKKRFVLTI